jgi:uncharacterized membrane protein YkoI
VIGLKWTLFVTAAGLFLSSGAFASAVQDAEYEALLKDSKVSLSEGIEKGLAEAKSGIVYKAELEGDKTTHWAVDVSQADKVFAVDIDAKTGQVVGTDQEATDKSKLAQSAKITILRAIEVALEKTPGKAVAAELKLDGDKPRFDVKILAKKKLKTVKVDAVSGQVGKKAQAKDEASAKAFTDYFPVEAGDWASTGRNPYFILEPGYFLILEGKEEGKDVRITITVLDETKKIDGVETRVVEDKAYENGQLKEVARDYFAFSRKTASVYYFGEDVDNYKDGKVANHDGSWLSGVKGAKYGLQMPGTPLLGARFYQEMAPGAGMDRIEILSLSESAETPAGKFEHCLKTEETSPLEPGVRENKLYAPGVGLLLEGGAKLVKYGLSTPGK